MVPNIRKRSRPVSPRVVEADEPAAIGHNQPADPRLRVEYRPLASLHRPARETRKHSKKQITQIAASMRRFGNLNPLLIDGDNRIVCGVGRYLAAKELGLGDVPVLCVAHLSAEELRLYAIAENKLHELSEWDPELLKLELGALQTIPGLELELTGFESLELEKIILDEPTTADAGEETESVDAPDDQQMPVSRLGDLYQIGEHRLFCGSAREPASFAALMGDEKARMVFADLPYNVKIANNVSGLGKVRHGEFVEGSGEMSRAQFTAFMGDIFGNVVAFSVDGSIHFQCMDWRHQHEMITAGEAHYRELKNLLIWTKTNAGMGTFYRSQHELIYVWKAGTARHVNNFGLGETGRYRSNVLRYAGCNVFRKGRAADLEAHSTVKPTALVADLIRDVSVLGDIVLDPCAGSGTTILAAERVKRRARCIELDPRYVDVAIRRAQERLGLEAIHLATGLTFTALAEQRAETDGNDGDEAGEDA